MSDACSLSETSLSPPLSLWVLYVYLCEDDVMFFVPILYSPDSLS